MSGVATAIGGLAGGGIHASGGGASADQGGDFFEGGRFDFSQTGDFSVGAADIPWDMVALGALALGALWLMRKR